MNSKATYLFALCFAFLFAGIQPEIKAQPYLGVVWEVPDDTSEAIQQLDTFARHGITYLELEHPVGSWTLNQLRNKDFTVLVRTSKSYLTLSEIKQQQNALIETYAAISEQYRTYFNVAAIGLLSHSQTGHPEFKMVFNPILDSLDTRFNTSFYYFTREGWFTFQYAGEPFATHFSSQNYHPKQLNEFNDRFQELNSDQSSQVLFLSSTWLLEALDAYPELSKSLVNYRDGHQWILPQPNVDTQTVSPNWLAFLLMLLWAALAISMKYLPYLRPMLLRYFLSHSFFVDDILHYRERAVSGGILLMIMHAVFGGIVFYITAQIVISPPGVDALFHHLPLLAITGVNYTSFFFIGLILVLITQFLAILWLYLPAKTLEHFSQCINLYAWLFFLDFLLVTVMVTLYLAGTGSSAIPILTGIFVVIWFAAFNIAAFNASGNMGSDTFLYLLLTIGLHTIISIGLIVLILTQNEVLQVIDLAISL